MHFSVDNIIYINKNQSINQSRFLLEFLPRLLSLATPLLAQLAQVWVTVPSGPTWNYELSNESY